MAFNAMACKKSMLKWDAIAKKAPTELSQAAKKFAGDHPEVAKAVSGWTTHINAYNQKLGDALDKVITAKDDKKQIDAAKLALGFLKQFESYVNSAHLPSDVEKTLKNGLLDLSKGLAI